MGVRASQTCGRFHTEHRCFARLNDAWRAELGDDVERPRWAQLLQSRVAIFDLDYDASISAMYALSFCAEGDCYRCVPPDPGIATTALGASASGTPPGTAPAEALHTFTLDSNASCCVFCDSTTLTPLPAPVPVRLADPSGGPVVARSSTVLPCPTVLSGSLSGLHFPSFSTNLVSTAALQDVMVTTTTPGGQHVSICTCTRTGRHLVESVHAGYQASSGRCVCSGVRVRSLPPLPHLPAPPCLPCVEGRQRAAPHSSSFPPTTAPLLTLHMDVWGPAHVSGQGRERYFLLVVDDYMRYTMVFPLRSKGEVSDVLIPWIRILRLQLRERSTSVPVSPCKRSRPHCVGRGRLAMRRCSGSGVLVPLFVIRPQTSSSPAPFPASSLALSLTRLAGSFTTPPRTVSSHLRMSRSTNPLPPQGPAPLGVSQVDPLPGTAPVEVAVGSGAAPGAASGGAVSGGAEPEVAESEGAGSGGAEPGGEEPGGAEPTGVEPKGAEPEGVEPGGAKSEGAESGGAEPRGAVLSGGAGDTGAGGAAVPTGAGGTGGTPATVPGGARPSALEALELEKLELGSAGGGGAARAGVGGTGARGAGAAGAGAVDPGAGGAGDTVRPRPYFVPLLQQPASTLPAPSPYTEHSEGLTERREPASCPVLPVSTARCAPHSRPPLVPGTRTMALRPSSVPLRVPLPAPPESSLPEVPDPASDRARIAYPTVARLLATAVTYPSFESAAASALVAELLDLAAACRLDYASALVA
ncbi:unnamed protein product [Closterium sp. NIES-54]